jgi:hypothetical protein
MIRSRYGSQDGGLGLGFPVAPLSAQLGVCPWLELGIQNQIRVLLAGDLGGGESCHFPPCNYDTATDHELGGPSLFKSQKVGLRGAYVTGFSFKFQFVL